MNYLLDSDRIIKIGFSAQTRYIFLFKRQKQSIKMFCLVFSVIEVTGKWKCVGFLLVRLLV